MNVAVPLACLALLSVGALPVAAAEPALAYAGLGIMLGPSYGAACELGLTVYVELTAVGDQVVAHAATLESALPVTGSFLLHSELGVTTIELDCGSGREAVTTGAPAITSASCAAPTGELEFTVAEFAFLSGLVACAA